ncbi:hypothetical protein CK247_29570, partial [Klebsiella pneumoniae]
WSISIQFVDGGIVISIYKGRRRFTRSAIYNASAYNSRKYNQKDTAFVITEDFEFAIFFKQAMVEYIDPVCGWRDRDIHL